MSGVCVWGGGGGGGGDSGIKQDSIDTSLTPEAKVEKGSRGLVANLWTKMFKQRWLDKVHRHSHPSPQDFTLVISKLLHRSLLLHIPEGTPRVSTGRQQLLVRTKKQTVCDEF